MFNFKTYFYGSYDSSINPHFFLEKKFGIGICHVFAGTYVQGIAAFLLKRGAILLESYENQQLNKEDEEQLEYRFMPKGDSSKLLLFKNNLIKLEKNDENWIVDIYHHKKHDSILSEIKNLVLNIDNKSKVSILLQTVHGLKVERIHFVPPIISDLELNYGTGFAKKHQQILDKLNVGKAGLICFHSVPGMGKSTYLKYLTSICDREFIFIPVGLVPELASPSFIGLLMKHKNAVLILEDAEQALQSREIDFYNSPVVSTLLNMSDGILGSLLNITIIATYNADKATIDKALLRKGRLLFDYTFEKLSVENAQKLAEHLKKNSKVTEPMTLADIYNNEDDTNYSVPAEKSMGFNFIKR